MILLIFFCHCMLLFASISGSVCLKWLTTSESYQPWSILTCLFNNQFQIHRHQESVYQFKHSENAFYPASMIFHCHRELLLSTDQKRCKIAAKPRMCRANQQYRRIHRNCTLTQRCWIPIEFELMTSYFWWCQCRLCLAMEQPRDGHCTAKVEWSHEAWQQNSAVGQNQWYGD